MISIKIKNIDPLIKKLDEAANARMELLIRRSLEDSSVAVLGNLNANTPVDTGRLKSSNRKRVAGDEALIGPDEGIAHYAKWVEHGHHTRGGGSWVPGQRYIMRTELESHAEVLSIFNRNFKSLFT